MFHPEAGETVLPRFLLFRVSVENPSTIRFLLALLYRSSNLSIMALRRLRPMGEYRDGEKHRSITCQRKT